MRASAKSVGIPDTGPRAHPGELRGDRCERRGGESRDRRLLARDPWPAPNIPVDSDGNNLLTSDPASNRVRQPDRQDRPALQ